MSSFKSRFFRSSRSESSIKSSSLRNVINARVKPRASSSQAAVEEEIAVSDQNDSNEEIRHRVSYTKEQKLAAIIYATNTFKTHKNESTRSIIKYVAAKDLDITFVML
jgi:hypothetical protein